MRLHVFAATAGILTCLMPAHLLAQPRLHIVGGASFDFGELYTPSAKKLLTLRNTGQDTLIISNVSASCGCTGVLMSHNRIAAGDSGVLAITFDAKRFSGPVEKIVSFSTNDKSQEHVRITFRATVNKTLEFEPEYFYFSTFPDSIATKELTIKNSSKKVIRLLRIAPSSEVFSVTASEDRIEPGQEITLTGSVKLASVGTFSGNVEITTDHSNVPSFAVRYFALVKERK